MDSYRWEKSYPGPVSWRAPLPPARPLQEMLQKAAQTWPERSGLHFHGQTHSFAELWGLANRAAAGLARLGVGTGTGVGLHLPNMPPLVAGFFGALIAGARVVNLSFLTSPSALGFQLRDAGVEVLITADPALPGSEAVKGVRAVLLCREDDLTAPAPEPGSFAALLHQAEEPPPGQRSFPDGRCDPAAIYRRQHRRAQGRDAQPCQCLRLGGYPQPQRG